MGMDFSGMEEQLLAPPLKGPGQDGFLFLDRLAEVSFQEPYALPT